MLRQWHMLDRSHGEQRRVGFGGFGGHERKQQLLWESLPAGSSLQVSSRSQVFRATWVCSSTGLHICIYMSGSKGWHETWHGPYLTSITLSIIFLQVEPPIKPLSESTTIELALGWNLMADRERLPSRLCPCLRRRHRGCVVCLEQDNAKRATRRNGGEPMGPWNHLVGASTRPEYLDCFRRDLNSSSEPLRNGKPS
jgi:hypothetical protein